MSKIVFGISLIIVLVAAGCGNSQLHQSLLLHENRRLEDALYVSHAQIADLKRENDSLRKQQESEHFTPQGRSWGDDLDLMEPFEMPPVILPGESGSSEVPDSLKGSQRFPTWSPTR
jgi:hypothetical protein